MTRLVNCLDMLLLLHSSLRRLPLLDDLLTLARLVLQIDAGFLELGRDFVVLVLRLLEPLLVLLLLPIHLVKVLARFSLRLRESQA